MQEYTDFEIKAREELFEEKQIGFALLDQPEDLDESEQMKTLLLVEGDENGPAEDEPGMRLLKTVEELRFFLEKGYDFYDLSKGVYEQFFLVKINNAPNEIKKHFLEVNKIKLEVVVKAIPKLSTELIEELLKTKSISFFSSDNLLNNLAQMLKSHESGAKLMNIFFQKEDNRIQDVMQREVIFKYFPDKLNMFENELVKGYLKDKDKSIFINDNFSNIIPIHVDLSVVVNKNNEMKFSLESLARHLVTISQQVKSCAGIEEIELVAKLKEDEISSLKMYFNLSSECVFKTRNLEEFLESYFEFITTIQHMQEDELVSNIHAWIPSQLTSMQLELALKDKPSINPKSKI